MQRFNEETGFLIADPDNSYIDTMPSYKSLLNAVDSMIISASGWRKVFAADGDEESQTEKISLEDYTIAAITALSFSAFIKKRVNSKQPNLLLGMDSRFTGPAIADAMTRIFLSEDIEVRSLFIIAAPEIMAYSAVDKDIDGFAYISASHNPIGHNGLKFGSNGGVYGGEESRELISTFQELLGTEDIIETVKKSLSKLDIEKYIKTINSIHKWKEKAYSEYLEFSKAVIADSDKFSSVEAMQTKIKTAAEKRKIGIISELNGSARTLSIDREILESYGITVKSINNKPREIVHRIVPEGLSLHICRLELEKSYKKDKRYILGYVPDNDGDRGNLVYIDEKSGKAKILEAQEVFSLAVLAELAFISGFNKENKKTPAIAINGPTSMRIDTIARIFKVKIFRAEVGESNVVNLAKDLRKKGYLVRILGEGSNGGNITHPAAVRDPINTVFSVIKLLLFKDFFKVWCTKSRQSEKYIDNYGISNILSTLPLFTTTSAYDDRAIMKIQTTNHALLKKRYEDIFIKDWNKHKDYLKENYGIIKWREINYEGQNEKQGVGAKFRSGKEKGGMKIVFSNKEEKDTDYIWMRGSGTEPVFRILADTTGSNKERETWLLKWHRSMIERADTFETKGEL
jgi:phosphoglucomutase